ncbi:MAG: preprotein translocase subunit YajC [Bdellovibrionales bacterium]|nr:preprotein translocase subunit YajC [Bdellovibrionales bacterium]
MKHILQNTFQPLATANTTAPASSPKEAPQQKPSIIEQFMPFIFIMLILYFLFIRPAQKRARKHMEFTTGLKRGQSVLTSGGLLGTIDGLTEQYVILEVSEGVKIRVLRSHISSSETQQKEQESSKTSSSKTRG